MPRSPARRGRSKALPLAVKDAQRVKGKRTTHGSLIFIDNIDDHSDPMIERLEAAGAIIHRAHHDARILPVRRLPFARLGHDA